MVEDARRAFRVCLVSAGWSAITSVAAIAFGISSNRLALIAYGATNVLDCASSTILAFHFHHLIKHEKISESRERRATKAVFCGLLFIGLATVIESIVRYSEHGNTDSATGGIIAAICSAVVLAFLSGQKLKLGRRLKSTPLFADGYLSAIGALLALVAAVSSAINRASVDAIASGIIGLAAVAAATFVAWIEFRSGS